MYVIYLAYLQRARVPSRPIIHLQFKTQLCEALLQNWPSRREDGANSRGGALLYILQNHVRKQGNSMGGILFDLGN
jgi:hypothetical protein